MNAPPEKSQQPRRGEKPVGSLCESEAAPLSDRGSMDRTDRPYIALRRNRLQVSVRSDWNLSAFIDLLSSDLEGLEGDPRVRRLPTSKNTAVYRLEGFQRPVYLKVFLYNHWRHVLAAPFSFSKARLAWEAGGLLIQKGLHTPPLIALGEERRFGFLRKSFFVTEEVQGIRLSHYLDQFDSDDRSTRDRIFQDLGKTLGRLHRCGILHGDLNITNILVVAGASPDPPLFYLLDNEGYAYVDRITARSAVEDLKNFFGRRIRALSLDDQEQILGGYFSARKTAAHEQTLLRRGLRIGASPP